MHLRNSNDALVPLSGKENHLWDAALTADDIAALNTALDTLGCPGFNTMFRRFTVANWTKDLSGVPDASYNYDDEDEAGNPAPYGPLTPEPELGDDGIINIGDPASWNDQDVTSYGARYYRAKPGANCPVISASFHKDTGPDAFYHIVTQRGMVFDTHLEGSGNDWTQSFLNSGITDILAVIGGQANSAQVDVTLSCADPVVDIKLPNADAVAYVGPFDSDRPGKFLAEVLVTNGSPTAPVVAGLTNNDFKAKVNGIDAPVTGGGFIQEQYWLVIDAPTGQLANGTYDLEIILEEPGTHAEIASDTNANSVTYDTDQTDHALVIDRSGSMGQSDKMEAAQDAANFYIDITRDSDGLSVVPFNHDVNPDPFLMQSVNSTVRDDAKEYVKDLDASGYTSIGDGLQEAVNQRAASPTDNPRCSFVLLSDGMQNRPEFWADVQADVVATGCPVTSIAFGPASNETLMQEIAEATGGINFYNDVYVSSSSPVLAATPSTYQALDLGDTYEYAQARNEGRQRLLAATGMLMLLREAPIQVHPVMVDDTVSEILFALDWDGNPATRMGLWLQKPNGRIISALTSPYTFYDAESGHLGWRIENPDPGQWEVTVFAFSQYSVIPYRVYASAHTNLTVELLLPDRLGSDYYTGNRIPIYAFVSGDRAVPDALVEAIVTAPNGTETAVRLYDDGRHEDGEASDGFYANLYPRVNQANEVAPSGEPGAQNPPPNDEGSYRVRVQAAHADFQREALGAFSVLEGEDANNNGLPDPFEAEYDVSDPDADPDLDELDNLDEYLAGTDPNNSDTDGGGENDGSEVLLHGQDPLAPGDDQIAAPDFFHAAPEDDAVQLTYDVKSEYDSMLLYRAPSPDGPWSLREPDLPLNGSYSDVAINGETYFHRLLAIDGSNHRSAIISSEAATPSHDPVPPEARVIINDGAPTTQDLNVSLSFVPYGAEGEEIESFADIVEMLISNDPFFESATWQPFAQNVLWQLAPTEHGELAYVYVRFRDAAGNESVGVEVGAIRFGPLSASDAAASDRFGAAAAISGNTAVVGSPGDADAGPKTGSVYVFQHAGDVWIEIAKLTASDAAFHDAFGFSVDISDDEDTIVVGAFGNDDAGRSSGAAYVFERNASGWLQTAKLTASDADLLDHLGFSVAINGDGTTVVAGTHRDDDAGAVSGSAYVFERGTGWIDKTEDAKLTASDGATFDRFGFAVDVSEEGDVVVIGAPGDDDAGPSSGSVYVFVRPGASWGGDLNEDTKLGASDAWAHDAFGFSVAINNSLVVGAPGEDPGVPYFGIGAVYVFEGSDSYWSEVAKLNASDVGQRDRFGFSIAIDDDTLTIGAPKNDDMGPFSDSGSIYIFVDDGSGWAEKAKRTAADAAAGDYFGFSIDVSNQSVIVGAPYDDNLGFDSGSVYIYR